MLWIFFLLSLLFCFFLFTLQLCFTVYTSSLIIPVLFIVCTSPFKIQCCAVLRAWDTFLNHHRVNSLNFHIFGTFNFVLSTFYTFKIALYYLKCVNVVSLFTCLFTLYSLQFNTWKVLSQKIKLHFLFSKFGLKKKKKSVEPRRR